MPLIAGIAALLVVLVGGGAAIILTSGNRQPTTNPTTGPTDPGSPPVTQDPVLPADEQCTDEIKANQRWVCLTSATIANGVLTVEYESEDNGRPFNINGGFHLHIYGANEDGSDPPDRTMSAGEGGSWYIEDQNPSVHQAGTDQYETVAAYPKVCARIANGNHRLVPDGDGAFKTGNCVKLTQT
jgi:hypothetical protein